jgi:hypothetical protein
MAATRLGAAVAGGAAATAPASSRLLAALAGGRILKPIRVPGLELDGTMTLLGSERAVAIEAEVLRDMQAIALPQEITTIAQFELERARRFLADAVREVPAPDATPGSLPPALGTASEWGQLPPATVADLWRTYNDLSEEHDPAGFGVTADEVAEIADAIEKKNVIRLRCFGVRRLASYLLTTAAPPASSPTPKSEPGDTSPAS